MPLLRYQRELHREQRVGASDAYFDVSRLPADGHYFIATPQKYRCFEMPYRHGRRRRVQKWLSKISGRHRSGQSRHIYASAARRGVRPADAAAAASPRLTEPSRSQVQHVFALTSVDDCIIIRRICMKCRHIVSIRRASLICRHR